MMKKMSSPCPSLPSPVNDTEVQPESSTAMPNPAKPVAKRSRKQKSVVHSSDSPGRGQAKRSSVFRGVTSVKRGRYEAHYWDKSASKKNRQIYLGAYDSEEAAARTYDLVALKYRGPGPGTVLNFPIETYTKELEEMQNLSKEEFLASLRRQSTGFCRGTSKYRGVSRHHHSRWEARIKSTTGTKYLYLGVFDTEEKAAAAYDIAAIQQRGLNALTNFDISNYADKLREIRGAQSNAQPIEGGESSRAREAQQLPDAEGDRRHPLLHNNRPAEFTELQPTQVLREADCVYSSALNAIVSDEDEFLKFWMKAAVDPYPVPCEYEAVDETAEGESYSLDCFDAASEFLSS